MTTLEGDHRNEDSEVFHFKSRHVDKALVEVAFGFGSVRDNHPMRYWAVAGWGPVPAALRAPEGVYREVPLSCLFGDLDGLRCYPAETWRGLRQDKNIIFHDVRFAMVRDLRWFAVIDVRDDTTIENVRIAPKTCDAVVCSPEELETFLPPVDTTTERQYMEMTSGEFLVHMVSDIHSSCLMIRVGNAAVGKWFWEFYPRSGESVLSQLVVWHESVDDTDEYKTPHQGPESELMQMCNKYRHDPSESDLLVEDRQEALAVVETFLWAADAEPQLKHAMAKFMTKDPNLWWKRGELPDGFLLSCFGFSNHLINTFVVGELRCEKLCFVNPVQALLNSLDPASAHNVIGGCAVRLANDGKLLPMQFKPSRATGKIVAMRAVFPAKRASRMHPL